MLRNILILIFLSAALLFTGQKASACNVCGNTVGLLGKDHGVGAQDQNQKWYFQYLFEQSNWDKMDARDAHSLHHAGHHFHDKTTEELHHFKFGSQVSKRLNVFADVPYVTRRSLEIDDHAILGSKQKSEGLGDLQFIGDYRFWMKDNQLLGVVGGIKLPSGATKEENTVGTRFEPELQPGSGSYDFIFGGVYSLNKGRMSLAANATHFFTNEGAQDFTAGAMTTLSVYADYLLNPDSERFKTALGIDVIFQDEARQRTDGVEKEDSGGQTILAGPVAKVIVGKQVSFFSSLLFPAYQHLGGVHQELDYQWTAGGRVAF